VAETGGVLSKCRFFFQKRGASFSSLSSLWADFHSRSETEAVEIPFPPPEGEQGGFPAATPCPCSFTNCLSLFRRVGVPFSFFLGKKKMACAIFRRPFFFSVPLPSPAPEELRREPFPLLPPPFSLPPKGERNESFLFPPSFLSTFSPEKNTECRVFLFPFPFRQGAEKGLKALCRVSPFCKPLFPSRARARCIRRSPFFFSRRPRRETLPATGIFFPPPPNPFVPKVQPRAAAGAPPPFFFLSPFPCKWGGGGSAQRAFFFWESRPSWRSRGRPVSFPPFPTKETRDGCRVFPFLLLLTRPLWRRKIAQAGPFLSFFFFPRQKR